MTTDKRYALCALCLCLALAPGCSDDGQQTNDDTGAKADSKLSPGDANSGLPDGYTLYPCDTPGKACNAHDPCAINPVCGADKKCRPTTLMNCDDKLSCTTDSCAGNGLCRNEPKKGFCKLPVKVPQGTTCSGVSKLKYDAGAGSDAGADAGAGPTETIFCCFSEGTRKPGEACMACNPTTSDGGVTDNTKWMPANGGACDDANACTKNDYCQNGSCKGTYFGSSCADGYGCTTDLCDGKGGCLGNTLKSGWCLINGACYADKANHPAGSCFTCDVSNSTAAWTPISNTCLIANKCYKKGDKSPTGCGECDPAKSTSAWTPLANMCLIGGVCYKPAAKHKGGCAECDPTVSGAKWTVKGDNCLISDTCHKKGAKHPSGCGECIPATDKYGWTMQTQACKNCKPFYGTVGKPCTAATATTDCGTGLLCLTTGATGVCTKQCTADNPATPADEDTCPGRPDNVCAGVPLSSGATMYLCMRRCRPSLGCNECDPSLVCHPQSGGLVGLRGQGVCLYTKTSGGCAKDADCNVTTGQACDTVKKNCPTSQTCLAYASDTAINSGGICAKPGKCDVTSALCKAHQQGKAGVKIGAPCKGDVDCANGMRCNLEFDEVKYRKKGGASCQYNSECCSGLCQNKFCTTGKCQLLWRNGHCGVSNCVFAKTLKQAACPAGSHCNKFYTTGLCQKSCVLTKAGDCRGHTADKLGDYECRDWSNVSITAVGQLAAGPVCDSGPIMTCDRAKAGTSIPDCATLGNKGNTTKMACRDLSNKLLPNKYDPNGYCLDNTTSAPAVTGDGGAAPKDAGTD